MSCCTVPPITMTTGLSPVQLQSETAVWFAGKMERVQADHFLMEVRYVIISAVYSQ